MSSRASRSNSEGVSSCGGRNTADRAHVLRSPGVLPASHRAGPHQWRRWAGGREAAGFGPGEEEAPVAEPAGLAVAGRGSVG